MSQDDVVNSCELIFIIQCHINTRNCLSQHWFNISYNDGEDHDEDKDKTCYIPAVWHHTSFFRTLKASELLNVVCRAFCVHF